MTSDPTTMRDTKAERDNYYSAIRHRFFALGEGVAGMGSDRLGEHKERFEMKPYSSRYSVAVAAAIAAVWLGLMSVGPHAAQAPHADAVETPRTADGKPDLTGLWTGNPAGRGTFGEQGDFVTGIDARGGNDGTGAGAVNFERDSTLSRRSDPNKPMYKAEFWEKIAYLDDNRNREDAYFSCGAPGLPRMGPPHRIVQTAQDVIFLYDTPRNFRVIPTDGRAHHPDRSLEPTFMGDSVAHWEGETLVVDVIGFNDVSWLDTPGYFHSFDMRVTERLRREGNVLHYQATVEDPVVLTEPWVMNPRRLGLNTLPWEDPASGFWEDVPCNETDLEHLVTKEHH